jgi:hypothetical protein
VNNGFIQPASRQRLGKHISAVMNSRDGVFRGVSAGCL